ncbi:hypothetical protein CLCR_09244 [Cladophialophora carrionii]|uniref:Uncharacterized protein n=1 Tax=Cladophialophora carrionii TaxID=86049 RepID=A0A1C1CRL2_9EURO|nr:hypothetical protein CLCR_09244 [Cladophialophora carrionii]
MCVKVETLCCALWWRLDHSRSPSPYHQSPRPVSTASFLNLLELANTGVDEPFHVVSIGHASMSKIALSHGFKAPATLPVTEHMTLMQVASKILIWGEDDSTVR